MAGNGKELISSLQDQGILNDYFDELKGLQDENDPCFVRECITIFLREAHDYRAELTTNLLRKELLSGASLEQIIEQLVDNRRGAFPASQSDFPARGGASAPPCASVDPLVLVGLDNVNREYLVTRENLNRIAEGILTDSFDDIKGLQDENNPRFVDETITIFLHVAEDYRADHSQEICN
ncbi:hypothetical protein L3X38_031716 [Prunus dulcis]|uniref:Histidine-containing phosphotransfer protein n=1 Tax=Prunus dulcis TaxID=3755 RepID=A0AAD4YVE3_PRUDU|nr:hypothetical protein L3X38_031716 [Prunus dulcis]